MIKRDTLLIVDDMEINRAILQSVFQEHYHILEAENGDQALALLNEHHSTIAAVLLDIIMPGKDGYEVLEEIGRKRLLREVPIIIITAEGSKESENCALELGASDIIVKPFEPKVVRRRVQNIIELNLHKLHLEELVEEQAARLRESNNMMMDALSSVIEYRNTESGQHILRIRMFTKILLEEVVRQHPEYELTEREINIIASASAMHDIGKIAIPDAILNKPGPLTKEEYEIMKTHSIKGCEILDGLPRMGDREYIAYAYNICRYHHERWDGRGYPDGLKGDNTPICAQVVGIADAFDALTTNRVYKKAFPAEKAFHMILNGECGTFSPKILECFKTVQKEFSDLSREYADGRKPEADKVYFNNSPVLNHTEYSAKQHTYQLKYMAMLQYANVTVLEADLNDDSHRLVYMTSQDFDTLRTDKPFSQAIQNFAYQAIHPADRPMVLGLCGEYMEDFIENGIMKRSRKYRIFNQTIGEYTWYEATIIRIDMDTPRQKKVLLLWKSIE